MLGLTLGVLDGDALGSGVGLPTVYDGANDGLALGDVDGAADG